MAQMMKERGGTMHLFEAGGQSSDSMITNTSSSVDPAQDFEDSYTLLRLGLVLTFLPMHRVSKWLKGQIYSKG